MSLTHRSPLPRRRRRAARVVVAGTFGALVLTAAVGTGAALAAPAQPKHPRTAAAASAAGPSFRMAELRMKDGVVLKANVFTPGAAGADAKGRYPVIVQPASWAQDNLEYIGQSRKLAADGYVVVTYTVRGFWGSGGAVDVAGAKDTGDISTVIDWALAHTPADPQRVGMTGLSLGGGLSLMGAAADPRVKAVAAMSGWGSLVDALYSGQTRHLQAAAMLTALQVPTGRAGTEFRHTLERLFADRDMPKVVEWARTRSPETYVDRINAHGTAVYLANAWGDSIFNPSQSTAFYEKLTGPKQLDLRPGDHATQEAPALMGLGDETWRRAHQWFDRHLKGEGGERPQPVELEVRPTGARESWPSWRAAGSRSVRLRLGKADAFGTGALGGAAGTGWRTSVTGGLDCGADGGIVELSGLLDQIAKLPPLVEVPLLPRAAGAVWQSERYAEPQRIRGEVTLHTTVTASATQGTVVAYLYDVNALGLGKLISHAPQSWHGKAAGRPVPLDVSLFATAYDLPAGHRLALVLDTADPLYATRTPLGSRVTFGSPRQDPSELTVPLR